jgi:putative transposase
MGALIQSGKLNHNAFVERFNRSVREEVLNAWPFGAQAEAPRAADDWLRDYGAFLPDQSLSNVPLAASKLGVFRCEVSASGQPIWPANLRHY